MNFAKSSFGAVGVERNTFEDLAHILNYRLMSLPFVYLGIPMVENLRLEETWSPILRKINRRLAKWKHKVLSLAGRVSLINFILSSIPLFFLSFFKMSGQVVKKIIIKERDFLWGCEEGNKKVSWVS